ncbi:IMP cyclohydrolase [Candidatus Bathyarchaeota archaeon]|nr:IMP cyclohydrolase [Candidatus Bathyarchaeota archaeon]
MEEMRKRYRTPTEEGFPDRLSMHIGGEEMIYEKAMSLRYGENPHQPAALYRPLRGHPVIGNLKLIKGGKGGLSQTNIEDVNNALNILKYFEEPACAVMKHLNPSGVAASRGGFESLRDIYIRARDCDSVAAYGSVVVFNSTLDEGTGEEVASTFVEVVAAPSFEEEAIGVLSSRRDLRIIQFQNLATLSRFIGDPPQPYNISILVDGSIIVSAPLLTRIRGPGDLRIVTRRNPTERELDDLIFSWYICMNVRSNGIVVSRDRATLGIGAGQQDRVTAVRLALEKAAERGHREELKGAVLASDGFFPFSDSVELMAKYGITACIQPGGSIRDEEVIKACEEHGIAMAFTDERCFRHF